MSLKTQIEKLKINKNDASSENYEKLGFKTNLGFGAKSELRDVCKRILRFAFLLDFVAQNSLANIYLESIRECI